ncbi:MAG: PEP-CTERM sorting domain-containing protein [Verrucomicrobiaceae bacterium]|nr:PEP-CTERM sorting domain-containing protein [Verrucomicrobiaceae bacterium]
MLEIGYGANADGIPSFSGGNDIALRIPEPSSAIALAAGAFGLAGLRRRRRT